MNRTKTIKSAVVLLPLLILGACFIPSRLKEGLWRFSLRGNCPPSKRRLFERLHFFKENSSSLSLSTKQRLQTLAGRCLKEGKAQTALRLYIFLLKESKKEQDRDKILFFEEAIADLSFSRLKNYEKALKFYVRLLGRDLPLKKKISIRMRIAESFFMLNRPSQTLRELKKIEGLPLSPHTERQKLFLKARALARMEDDKDKAVSFFQKLMKKYPEQADFFREYLAILHEGQKDFAPAIEELEKIKAPSGKSWTQEKIRRLRERQKNQPGIEI